MTNKLSVLTVLCLLVVPAPAFADEPGAWLPRTALFIGIGGSYNSAEVDQDLSGTAI